MVNPPPGPDSDPQLQALTALAGWRQFASEMPAVPELLDRKVWQGLDADKRVAYDDDRIAHHSRLLIVQTPAVRDVVTTGRRLAHLNRSAYYGRSGLIVSGPARPGPDREDDRDHPARQDHRGLSSPPESPLAR